MVIVEIRAKPMHVMGWFDRKLAIAWRNIFLLTGGQCKVGISTTHGSNLGKDVESVVAIPGQRLASGGGTKKCVEGASPNVAGSSVMQRKPNEDTLGEKDVRSSTHVHLHNGESALHEDYPSVQANSRIQHTCRGEGDEFGSVGASTDSMPRERKGKGDDGIDGMEFEGSRDFPPSDECPTPFHQLTMNSVKL